MNLVQPSIRRPFTIVALVVGVVLAAVVALRQMPRDIFPSLGIPTIYVAQPFGGMDPAQMEGYLTYYYKYHFLYITGIEHVESKSIQGASIVKLQFYPGTDMSQAMSETVAYVNRARAFMPPGTVPPFIMRFDAGSVPVGNLVFSSDSRSVAEMQDAALNLVRPLFATLPGVSAPPPFGGSARSIVVNVKPDKLRAYNMSPDEIVAALTAANTISPSGNMPIGKKYPMVPLNSVVKNIKDLERVARDCRLDVGGRVGRSAHRGRGSPVLARLAQRAGRRAEHSAGVDGRGGGAVDHRSDGQHHDAGRLGTGHRHPRGHVHRRDREHPHASRARQAHRQVGGRFREGSRVAAVGGDVLRAGGFRSGVLHGRRGEGDVHPALARGRFFHGRILSAGEHLRAGRGRLAYPSARKGRSRNR